MIGRAGEPDLRLAFTVAVAVGLTHAICSGLSMAAAPAAYAALVSAIVIRPDFHLWPLRLYPALMLIIAVAFALGLGVSAAFVDAPEVFQFAIASAVSMLLTPLLPPVLMVLAPIFTVFSVIPLLETGPTLGSTASELLAVCIGLSMGAVVQAVCTPDPPYPPSPSQASSALSADLWIRYGQVLSNVLFWRKLVLAAFALAIGYGIGAATPKYLDFGVVLLLMDSVGASLLRAFDRIVGVSLGIAMPLLVFNGFGLNSFTIPLVMGTTTLLVCALGLQVHLRTALISSAVAFIGYGPLVDWYIPNRWLDYFAGSLLALLASLVITPRWVLPRYRALQSGPATQAQEQQRRSLKPLADAESLLLGQAPTPSDAPADPHGRL